VVPPHGARHAFERHPGAAATPLPRGYRPRRAETTALYRVVADHVEMLVPFSCKARGLCPSCDGRRMADTAAHLVARVLPSAGYRQWTLSFPRWLHVRLLREPTLVSALLTAFVRSVFADHRRRARSLGVRGAEVGAVTGVQRFGSFVNANLHFHTLVPDGVWQELPDGSVAFHSPRGSSAALRACSLAATTSPATTPPTRSPRPRPRPSRRPWP
jgi:hypothetical protein